MRMPSTGRARPLLLGADRFQRLVGIGVDVSPDDLVAAHPPDPSHRRVGDIADSAPGVDATEHEEIAVDLAELPRHDLELLPQPLDILEVPLDPLVTAVGATFVGKRRRRSEELDLRVGKLEHGFDVPPAKGIEELAAEPNFLGFL
jgi:hypothetical protein